MNLVTRCPACDTTFEVVQEQLRIADGWARCGRCSHVFDASIELLEIGKEQMTAASLGEVAIDREAKQTGATAADWSATVADASNTTTRYHSIAEIVPSLELGAVDPAQVMKPPQRAPVESVDAVDVRDDAKWAEIVTGLSTAPVPLVQTESDDDANVVDAATKPLLRPASGLPTILRRTDVRVLFVVGIFVALMLFGWQVLRAAPVPLALACATGPSPAAG